MFTLLNYPGMVLKDGSWRDNLRFLTAA